LAKYSKPQGIGGRSSTTVEKKADFQKPVPKSGAFQRREIPQS
jgi:hypothetical protein